MRERERETGRQMERQRDRQTGGQMDKYCPLTFYNKFLLINYYVKTSEIPS